MGGHHPPALALGTFLRTLVTHGMPHFENSHATRGAPILSSRVMRDFGAKDHLSWEHLALIRRRWNRTLVVKGIMNHDDARKARDMGVDGVIVSNHGGRQLDGTISPLRVLPEVVAAVGSDFPVMMDSGIRRGTDVLKALALGAKSCSSADRCSMRLPLPANPEWAMRCAYSPTKSSAIWVCWASRHCRN